MCKDPKDPIKSLAGKIGSHTLHSRYNSKELTKPGRAAFLKRFDDEVDPNRELDPTERARRAEHARKAYFARLALKRWQGKTKAGRGADGHNTAPR